jgi:hypothetical protein
MRGNWIGVASDNQDATYKSYCEAEINAQKSKTRDTSIGCEREDSRRDDEDTRKECSKSQSDTPNKSHIEW